MQVTAKFILERETKGALLYKEVDDKGNFYQYPNSPGCKIGNIYIRKSALNGSSQPREITITVSAEE